GATNVSAWASDDDVLSPAIIQFRAGAEGPGAPFYWLWDFGDGTFSTEQDPAKAYVVFDAPQTFTATLYAYNDLDVLLGSEQLTIDVMPPTPDAGNIPPTALLQWEENLPAA